MTLDRDRLLAQLARHEGLRLRPYRDSVGYLTIGYGRNLDTVGITPDEARYLLNDDVDRTIQSLVARHPWVLDLDPVRQAVIVNMVFNLGLDGLDRFVVTLRAMQQGRYSAAADAMVESKWAVQVGPRAVELAAMMKTGQWQI